MRHRRATGVNRPFLPLLLLLTPLAAGCNGTSPYTTTVGALSPGATITVNVGNAPVNVYAPEASQPRTVFTVAATAIPNRTPPPAPTLRAVPRGVVVNAPQPLAALLVRVPNGVAVAVHSQQGDVNVTDIPGNAEVSAGRGNVALMLPGYAQAAVRDGALKVTMGSTDWPGTLHFSTQRGDIDLRISANAQFTVHLHTASGTLFTDFGLRGVSSGSSETIDGAVNGGGPRRVNVESASGSIRLLRLQPQP